MARGPSQFGDRGFSAEARRALDARTDHLIAGGLARRQGHRAILARNLIDTLRDREVDAVAARLAEQHGSPYAKAAAGEHVCGIYRQRFARSSDSLAAKD